MLIPFVVSQIITLFFLFLLLPPPLWNHGFRLEKRHHVFGLAVLMEYVHYTHAYKINGETEQLISENSQLSGNLLATLFHSKLHIRIMNKKQKLYKCQKIK